MKTILDELDLINDYATSTQFRSDRAGYVLEDGSYIFLENYRSKEKNLDELHLPEFSNTHPGDDTYIRIYEQPTAQQYEALEQIADTYLAEEACCCVELWKKGAPRVSQIYELEKGAYVGDPRSHKLGEWTSRDVISFIRRYFSSPFAALLETLSYTEDGEVDEEEYWKLSEEDEFENWAEQEARRQGIINEDGSINETYFDKGFNAGDVVWIGSARNLTRPSAPVTSSHCMLITKPVMEKPEDESVGHRRYECRLFTSQFMKCSLAMECNPKARADYIAIDDMSQIFYPESTRKCTKKPSVLEVGDTYEFTDEDIQDDSYDPYHSVRIGKVSVDFWNFYIDARDMYDSGEDTSHVAWSAGEGKFDAEHMTYIPDNYR